VPRDCKYIARVKAEPSDFTGLYEAANRFANGSDRYVAIQPGFMAFHFEVQGALIRFINYVADRNLQLVTSDDQHDLGKSVVEAKKETSENFRAGRELVHDDALEAQIALHMVTPLLKNVLNELKLDYLHDSGLFLRRALVRYLALALYRLLDKPNDRGTTGITASISSLLEIAKSEKILNEGQIEKLTSDFEKIKTDGADGEYDFVQALRDLRTIQVAHSLIPWKDPTDQLWASHLVDFAEAVFNFVVKLETALAEATGVTLKDLRENANAFESSAVQFWRALTCLK
jgi:hypothetical protein